MENKGFIHIMISQNFQYYSILKVMDFITTTNMIIHYLVPLSI